MLESVKSVFSITSLQLSPAPAIPIPLLVAAHASDATWVPWPTWSVPAGPVELNNCWSIGATASLEARSGWVASIPESITPTSAWLPVETSHACGKPSSVRYHWYGTPSFGSTVV